MTCEKGSHAQSTKNGGTVHFDHRADDAANFNLNGLLEDETLGDFFNPVISPDHHEARVQGSSMTVALFVESKFVPEHVQYKTPAGQTHYQAILKHVITPEAVSRIFAPERPVKTRLTAVENWPYLDSIRLCDLRSEHVRRIVSAANHAGYSAQTVKHIKNVCFAIIGHAQKEGCFNGLNPASLVKLPRTMRSTPTGLTPGQIAAILDLLHHPYREVALFALTTGLSLPEICDLRWKNLNLDDCERFADGQSTPANTVLVKSWWNRGGLGDSRTCHKNKIIEIREPLLSALREVQKSNPKPDAEDFVLISADGNGIIPAHFRTGEIKRVGKAVGIPSLTWQDLRRTHHAFQANLIAQRSSSFPLHQVSIRSGWPNTQASSDHEPLSPAKLVSRATPPRTFCFGRRLRAATEAELSIDKLGGEPAATLII